MAKTQTKTPAQAAPAGKKASFTQPTDYQVRLAELSGVSGHSEADIKAKVRQVKDLFPTISDDKAVQILHDCNYDVERTVNRLFDGETTETSSAEPSGDSWVESRSKKGRKKAQERDGGDDFASRRDGTPRGTASTRGGRMNGETSRGRGGRGGSTRDDYRPPRDGARGRGGYSGSIAPRHQAAATQQAVSDWPTSSTGDAVNSADGWADHSSSAADVAGASTWGAEPAAAADSGWGVAAAQDSDSTWPAATTATETSTWTPAPAANTTAAPAPKPAAAPPSNSWAALLFAKKETPPPVHVPAPAPAYAEEPQLATETEEYADEAEEATYEEEAEYYEEEAVVEEHADYHEEPEVEAEPEPEPEPEPEAVEVAPVPEPAPVAVQEQQQPIVKTVVVKKQKPAMLGADPVIMPRSATPLGDVAFGSLGISFGMLTTEDTVEPAAPEPAPVSMVSAAPEPVAMEQPAQPLYQPAPEAPAPVAAPVPEVVAAPQPVPQAHMAPAAPQPAPVQQAQQPQQQQQQAPRHGGKRQGGNNASNSSSNSANAQGSAPGGQQMQQSHGGPQHHRGGYGHHMAPMQPAMSHHALQHGYPQGPIAYGVDPAVDPAMGMGMGYGYPHPVSGIPTSFGMPGWGYAAYDQAEPVPRGPAIPGYYDPASAYGARAPGGSRDRAAEKYGQGAATAESISGQAAQSAHDTSASASAIPQQQHYMPATYYGHQYQYPMYSYPTPTYNVPSKFSGGYVYTPPTAAAPSKGPQSGGYGTSGKSSGYSGYSQPAQSTAAPSSVSSFGGLQSSNRTSSPGESAADMYKNQQAAYDSQKSSYNTQSSVNGADAVSEQQRSAYFGAPPAMGGLSAGFAQPSQAYMPVGAMSHGAAGQQQQQQNPYQQRPYWQT